jgi:hypothetical protein
MIKNVFLPLVLIVLTGAATVYVWYEGLPIALFGVIGLMILGLGSIYISYFISYKIFPDKRNKPLPPVQDLLLQYDDEKRIQQSFTIGSLFGALLAIILIIGGVYSLIKLGDKYANYELEKYGQLTKAVITGVGFSKGIATYREFEYYDDKGKKYKDRFSNKTFNIGDTLTIMYSTNRPVIYKVITPLDRE